jgi:eukaryotic-like serine/threonine-protein kinase
MPLTPGTRLGPYEILSAIGAGGMGEVYRARDAKLDRHVALKVLRGLATGDRERLTRFEREARVLAAINHPNIAQVYGFEDSGSTPALVMELVEGPTLAERLAQGALGLDEALPLARQIADALEAAHEQGIVHRDLKPANIKLRDDGMVKVLDFGLAKMADPAPASSGAGAVDSPTMALPLDTGIGVILGTAAYMAPEQARGKAADRRADIWAFGVIVFEMLTGRPLFAGSDTADTLVAVLSREPAWTLLPPRTPPSVRRLIGRCLARDPRARLDSMSVARLEIEEAMAAPSAPALAPAGARTPRGWPMAVALLAIGLAIGAAGAAWLWRTTDSEHAAAIVSSLSATPEAVSAFTYGFALSPDRTTLVYAARQPDGRRLLWRRRLADARAEPMAGTEGAMYPFWSPDSRHVAFFAGNAVKRLPVAGGQVQTITDAAVQFPQGSWSARDEVLFHTGVAGSGIKRVPAGGGRAALVPLAGDAWKPQWLPDGRHLLFTRRDEEPTRLYAAAVDSPAGAVPVLEFDQPAIDDPSAVYSTGGFLVLNRAGALAVQRFDVRTLTTAGPLLPIGHSAGTPRSWFAVSAAGRTVLALNADTGETGGTPGDPISRLLWVDRAGRVTGQLGAPARYWTLRLSRDGQRALVNPDTHLWAIDARTGSRTRVAQGVFGVWMPGDRSILYGGPGGLYVTPSSGEGESRTVLELSNREVDPLDVSPDGRLAAVAARGEHGESDLWLMSLEDGSRRRLATSRFDERQASLSPDGRWVAYASNATGRYEVYARLVDGDAAPIQLSADGGEHPLWRANGEEVFFLSPTDEIVAVDVTLLARTGLPGARQVLFRMVTNDIVREDFAPYAVSPDGQRFLVNAPAVPEPLTLIQLPARW